MTTEQLYHDIRAMGFDRQNKNGEADTESVFLSSVNRAQETLAALFPLYEECILNTDEPEARMKATRFIVNAHESLSRSSGIARSYIFTLRGKGEAIILKKNLPFARYTVDSPHAYRTFIGEFPENASFRITLQAGDSALELTDLKVYTEAGAAREKHADFYIYTLHRLIDGALSLDAPPLDESGNFLREGIDYRLQNGRLYLSDKVKGQLKLTLRRAPARFSMDRESPDVRKDCAHLLPLLTASYVWLDDDREKSLFYLTMYRESLARTLKSGQNDGVGGYITSNGW